MKLHTSTHAQWENMVPFLKHYLDGLLNFTDPSLVRMGGLSSPVGIEITLPTSTIERIVDILMLTDLSNKIVIEVKNLDSQDDPHEQEVLSKLYPAGDTTLRPPKPKDREIIHHRMIHKHKAPA